MRRPCSPTIDVTLNRPPYFTTPARTWATVGKAYAYHAGAADPDGQRVTFSAASATGLAIDPDTGLARWIPEAGSYSSHRWRPIPGGFRPARAWINVQPAATSPPSSATCPGTWPIVGREYAWLVDAVDPDHTLTQLTFSVTPPASTATCTSIPPCPTGCRRRTRPPRLAGQQVSLYVTVTDPLGTAKRTWPVTVRQNNFPLVTVSDQTITAGQTFAYGVSATDADTLHYALVAYRPIG